MHNPDSYSGNALIATKSFSVKKFQTQKLPGILQVLGEMLGPVGMWNSCITSATKNWSCFFFAHPLSHDNRPAFFSVPTLVISKPAFIINRPAFVTSRPAFLLADLLNPLFFSRPALVTSGPAFWSSRPACCNIRAACLLCLL